MKNGKIMVLAFFLGVSSLAEHAVAADYDMQAFLKAQAGSYGQNRDLKALAAAMVDDIGKIDCGHDILTPSCRVGELSRVVMTAIGLSEQGKYQDATKYWSLHFSQLGEWDDVMRNTKLFRAGSSLNFGCPIIPVKIVPFYRPIREGGSDLDFYDVNTNWYYYQAKLKSGEKDIGPWLHKSYLCGMAADNTPVRYIVKRDMNFILARGKTPNIDTVLWDGRQLRNGKFADGSSLPINYSRQVILKEYVPTVREILGESEAVTAQRFVDEILKPLWAAEDKVSQNFETQSVIQQQDKSRSAQRDAALAALYDKAVIATANRNFPSIYGEILKSQTLQLMERTTRSIE